MFHFQGFNSESPRHANENYYSLVPKLLGKVSDISIHHSFMHFVPFLNPYSTLILIALHVLQTTMEVLKGC
jgi:hypothetical protein